MSIDLASFDTTSATIACDSQTHTIRWRAGELLALDHGESEEELALAALGGTSVPCLDILTAWRRHRRDHRLLSALTRGPGDFVALEREQHTPARMAMLRRTQRGNRARMIRNSGMSRAVVATTATQFAWGPTGRAGPAFASNAPSDAEEIELLARLGGAIPWRLAATVTAAMLQGDTPSTQPPAVAVPALTGSLYGRARATLSNWRSDPDLQIDLEVLASGEPPHLEATDENTLRVALPLSWVADVWARGVALIGEGFTLAIVEAGPNRIVVETIASDLRTCQQLAIQMLNVTA